MRASAIKPSTIKPSTMQPSTMQRRILKTLWVRLAVVGLLLLATAASARAQSVSTLTDIDFWVGSGSQATALAIDWNGESSSDTALVWGYRWEGVATGSDLLHAVLAADPRLFAKLSPNSGFGTSIWGLGYDQNNDHQFALDDGTEFDASGISLTGASDGALSLDAQDWYEEGWFLGYWHLGSATTNPFAGGYWGSATAGINNLALADQGWVSLAYTTDPFSISEFAENPLAAASNASADFNSNGLVDGEDFLTWQRGWGTTPATRAVGDANGDQTVDQADLVLWSNQYGAASALGGLATLSTVPEPHSVFLLLMTLLTYLGWRSPAGHC